MERLGTLLIQRLEPSRGGPKAVYSLAFLPADTTSNSHTHRCHGDFALLRVLEELLPAPDLRLTALELVRGDGTATLTGVNLSATVILKYGLDGARESGPSRRGQPGGDVRPCAVCGRPVPAHDRLTTVSGDVVHYECRPSVADVVEPAARFVAGADGRPFCQTCLAALLHISFEEARKVFGHLRMRMGFRLGTGQCSMCRKFRVTIWSTGTGPQSREERLSSEPQ